MSLKAILVNIKLHTFQAVGQYIASLFARKTDCGNVRITDCGNVRITDG